MFGRGKSTLFNEVSDISDSSLIWYYLNIDHIPCVINSPLREDKHPSFGLWSMDGVHIHYTDFATKETGSTYDLLSKLFCCTYNEVPKKILKDFKGIGLGATITKVTVPETIIHTGIQHDIKVEVKTREWRQYDIDYWESYGVPLKWLKFAEVYPISHKIVTKDGKKYTFGADKYAYVFVEHKEDHVTLKIYQPFNKNGFKWTSTHDRSVVSLWTKVPEYGDKIIICSSLKDALCMWSNTGIPCLALQGEGYGISDTAISELKRRYENIYILFDSDQWGENDAKKLVERTGFKRMILPQFEGGKDISDMYKVKGKEDFMGIITSIIRIEESLPF